MEEHADLFVQALPPILSSVGGFFVLIFFGYGREQKQKRIMSAALLVLLVWIANVCVVMAGEKLTMFSTYITLLCLLIAVVLFSVAFYINLRVNEPSDTVMVSLFVFGVLFSTVGFVNYFAMKDRVVIAVSNELCEDTIILKRGSDGAKYSVRESGFLGEVGFVVSAHDYSKIDSISFSCPNKSEKKHSLTAFNKSSRGLGVEYVLYKDQ